MDEGCDYTEMDYAELQRLDLESRGMLCSILSLHGGEHLTICPKCGMDHFVHDDGCPLAMEGKPVGHFARDDDKDVDGPEPEGA